MKGKERRLPGCADSRRTKRRREELESKGQGLKKKEREDRHSQALSKEGLLLPDCTLDVLLWRVREEEDEEVWEGTKRSNSS